ncbi:hypothetical protein [Streptomyces sp. NPDC002209]|uniref:hypothetical protein n=1 Tax=Streptomyces sp. NPDC002209 TaxID=3364638 RepID=UPI00368C45D9
MSGTDIPMMGLLGAFVVTGGLARLAAGRRRGPLGISAALLAVQGVLHLVFSGSQAGHGGHAGHAGHTATSVPTPLPLPLSLPEPMPGHHHLAGTALPEAAAGAAGAGGTDGMAGMADMSGMAGMADMAGHGGLGMIAAHVLAGLFCAAWLAWGEAAVFRLAAVLGSAALLAARPLARAVALVRARVAPVPPRPAPRPAYLPPRRLRGALPAHALVRRGPPGWRDIRATAPGRPACA